MSHHQITCSDGVLLHATTLGNADNPALVLVHGYPDNHRVWMPVARLLSQDFFVILYDVRGAGASGKGKNIKAYALPQLGEDLIAVVDQIIPQRPFHLAAHDWGSIQSWESATNPQLKGRLLSFTSISGPCLDHAGYWMRSRLGSSHWQRRKAGLLQFSRSWYISLFQLPVIAPSIWRLAGQHWPKLLASMDGIKEAHPNPTQIDDGVEGINLYRANFLKSLAKPRARYAQCPVQLVIAKRDNFVGEGLFEDLDQWAKDVTRVELDASHWVILKEPATIAKLIADYALQHPH